MTEPHWTRVREHLRRLLPGYMVPARFVVLDEIPADSQRQNRSSCAAAAGGGLNKHADAAPDADRGRARGTVASAAAAGQRSVPRTISSSSAAIRLLATQLVSRIRDAFDVVLPLTTIFTAQTLRELAARVDQLERSAGARSSAIRPPTAPNPFRSPSRRSGSGSCTSWNPTIPSTTRPMALRLRGRLDKTALQAALQDLMARHEVLRTAFVDRDGQPHQVIVADLQLQGS